VARNAALCSAAIFIWACAALACSTMRDSSAKYEEQALTRAGFEIHYAETPEEKAHIDRVKQRRMLQIAHDGGNRYVFADKKACNCIYVGDRDSYDRYQAIVRADMAQNQLGSSLVLGSPDASLRSWEAWQPW